MAPRLSAREVTFSYDGEPVLDRVDLDLEAGEMVALIGPNGAGKSTLLRCLSRALRPQSGGIFLDEVDIRGMKPRQLARQMGMVPQSAGSQFDFTVYELVAMGRNPYLSGLRSLDQSDLAAIDRAMAVTEVSHLAERSVQSLSGGEQQRVAVARALAQEPSILLLDEPTAHLDIRYQLDIMVLLQRLNQQGGMTIVAAVHDLNLAARYFPRLVLLAAGRVVSSAPARQVLDPRLMADAYGVEVVVLEPPPLGCPLVLPVGRA